MMLQRRGACPSACTVLNGARASGAANVTHHVRTHVWLTAAPLQITKIKAHHDDGIRQLHSLSLVYLR